jgi:hypothetical protein
MFQGVVWSFKHIFYLLAGPKCDLGYVEKAILHRARWPCELILGLLVAPNCDFGEVEKAILNGWPGPCKLTCCVLACRNYAFGMVEKTLFQGVAWACELILSSSRPKLRLGRVRNSDVSRRRWALLIHRNRVTHTHALTYFSTLTRYRFQSPPSLWPLSDEIVVRGK